MSKNYQSYLLRIWLDNEFGTWRASLTNIATREWQAFPNIVNLFSYLQEQTREIKEKDMRICIQENKESTELQEGD